MQCDAMARTKDQRTFRKSTFPQTLLADLKAFLMPNPQGKHSLKRAAHELRTIAPPPKSSCVSPQNSVLKPSCLERISKPSFRQATRHPLECNDSLQFGHENTCCPPTYEERESREPIVSTNITSATSTVASLLSIDPSSHERMSKPTWDSPRTNHRKTSHLQRSQSQQTTYLRKQVPACTTL